MEMAHICDQDCLIVNRDGIVICRTTGVCRKQFITANEYKVDTNPFHIKNLKNTEFKGCKKNIVKKIDPEIIKNEVETFLKTLLYSKKRKDLFSKLSSVTTQKNTPPQKRHHKKRRTVSVLEFDEEQFRIITNNVCEIIQELFLKKQSLKLKPLIIALLYLKQHGKIYNTKSQKKFEIKQSDYLYNNLPSVSDLHLFGFQKNLIRIGSNTIQKIVRNM